MRSDLLVVGVLSSLLLVGCDPVLRGTRPLAYRPLVADSIDVTDVSAEPMVVESRKPSRPQSTVSSGIVYERMPTEEELKREAAHEARLPPPPPPPTSAKELREKRLRVLLEQGHMTEEQFRRQMDAGN